MGDTKLKTEVHIVLCQTHSIHRSSPFPENNIEDSWRSRRLTPQGGVPLNLGWVVMGYDSFSAVCSQRARGLAKMCWCQGRWLSMCPSWVQEKGDRKDQFTCDFSKLGHVAKEILNLISNARQNKRLQICFCGMFQIPKKDRTE